MADVLTATDEGMLGRYLTLLKPKGLLIADVGIRKIPPTDGTVERIPALRIAKTHIGTPVAANVVLLAALVKAAKLVKVESVMEAVRVYAPSKSVRENLNAFQEGLDVLKD